MNCVLIGDQGNYRPAEGRSTQYGYDNQPSDRGGRYAGYGINDNYAASNYSGQNAGFDQTQPMDGYSSQRGNYAAGNRWNQRTDIINNVCKILYSYVYLLVLYISIYILILLSEGYM